LISGALIFAGALPTHNRQHNYRIPLNVTARILRLSVANARRTTQLPPPVLHASSLDVSACIFVPARCQSTTGAQPPTQLSNNIDRHRPHFAPERCQRTTNNTTSPTI
jgi:hypothetical protein